MWYAYVGGDVMAMSQQEKTDYKRKYNEEKYERIGLYLFPDEKKEWKEMAKSNGMSLNEFIKMCVNEKISHDKGRQ